MPSGALLATWAAPSEPAAPDLFSTSTVRPSLVCRWACSSRAIASVEPPGGNGTTSVMTFAGCASAGVTAKAADAASMVRLVIFRMAVPPECAALVLLFAGYELPKPDPGFLYSGRGGLKISSTRAPSGPARMVCGTLPGVRQKSPFFTSICSSP